MAEMPFASTVIFPVPSTHILWPLAVKRIVGSPDWKRLPLLLAAVVLDDDFHKLFLGLLVDCPGNDEIGEPVLRPESGYVCVSAEG